MTVQETHPETFAAVGAAMEKLLGVSLVIILSPCAVSIPTYAVCILIWFAGVAEAAHPTSR